MSGLPILEVYKIFSTILEATGSNVHLVTFLIFFSESPCESFEQAIWESAVNSVHDVKRAAAATQRVAYNTVYYKSPNIPSRLCGTRFCG